MTRRSSARRAAHALAILALGAALGLCADPPGTGAPPQNDTKKPLNNSGCTCDQVTVTLTTEPPKPPGIALVPCASPKAAAQDNYIGVYKDNGAGDPLPQKWGVTVTGPSADCCTKVRTGLIQNLLSSSFLAEYSRGGKLTNRFVKANGTPLALPLVDADPPGQPGSAYPYYDAKAVGSPSACGVEVPLEFRDFPPPPHPDFIYKKQQLRHLAFTASFRLFVVYECPVGTYNVLAYYDWTLSSDIVFDPAKRDGSTISFKACAEETARGVTPPAGPTTTGDTANTAGERPLGTVETGF